MKIKTVIKLRILVFTSHWLGLCCSFLVNICWLALSLPPLSVLFLSLSIKTTAMGREQRQDQRNGLLTNMQSDEWMGHNVD